MGMFDSVYANLKCPKSGLEDRVEVQFKWSECILANYEIGDQLKIGPYGNLWIKEDYLCDGCTKYEPYEVEGNVIGNIIKDPVLHIVYIHLEQGKILEILSDGNFRERFFRKGRFRMPKGQRKIKPCKW